jgi:hypothetical protein
MAQNSRSAELNDNSKGEIDLLEIAPVARPNAAGRREQAERAGLAKVDGRLRRRKNRTEPMCFRFSPATVQLIRRLADAENASYVEIVEQALAMLDAAKKGRKP